MAAERKDLWSPVRTDYPQHNEHVLEQYKLYIASTENISDRRQKANSFFLATNTALIAFFGVAWEHDAAGRNLWLVIVAATGWGLSFAWGRLVASYRQLNTAKFHVIHEIEKRLPLNLYVYEWEKLGSGKDPKRYRSFTQVESIVPYFFAALYLGLAVLCGFTAWMTK